jgi:hypothetical protein
MKSKFWTFKRWLVKEKNEYIVIDENFEEKWIIISKKYNNFSTWILGLYFIISLIILFIIDSIWTSVNYYLSLIPVFLYTMIELKEKTKNIMIIFNNNWEIELINKSSMKIKEDFNDYVK